MAPSQSPLDVVYERIYGHLPAKRGTAFEHFSAIAVHLLEEGTALVTHDSRLRGAFSESLHQVDVHAAAPDGATVAEAKDYSSAAKKTGREDLQKLVGAIVDLPDISSARFFSATGYTGPALKYAAAADQMLGGKGLDVFTLRPSVEYDDAGTIRKILVAIRFDVPQIRRARFSPSLAPSGNAALLALAPDNEHGVKIQYGLSGFLDKDGAALETLEELTTWGYGDVNEETMCSHGCYWLPRRHLAIQDLLIEIRGLEFEMPYVRTIRELVISDESESRLTLLDADGNVLKVLTDRILRRLRVREDGRVIDTGC